MGIKHSVTKTSGERGYASEWNDDHVIDGNVDFAQHQFLNAVIECRTDFPASPVEGQMIYRTDEKKFYIYDGTTWLQYAGVEDLKYIHAYWAENCCDSAKTAKLILKIPGDVTEIKSVKLDFYREKAKVNVNSTTGAGGGGNFTTGGPSTNYTSYVDLSHTHSVNITTNTTGDHNHLMFTYVGSTSDWTTNTQLTVYNQPGTGTADFMVRTSMTEDIYTKKTGTGNHSHTVAGNTGGASISMNHRHTLGSHTHSVSIGTHTHTLTYGCYEGSAPTADIGIKIDGTDRTVDLGGPWSSDQTDIDISAYITTTGAHTIELYPTSTQFMRIAINVVAKVK